MSRKFMFSWYFLISNPIPLFSESVLLEEIHGHMTNCDAVKIHA